MRVYLAADFARQAEIKRYADGLEAVGVVVTSSWLVEESEDAIPPGMLTAIGVTPHRARQCAVTDAEEIRSAEAFVQFTTGEKARGGRHNELGIAIAYAKEIFIVGPSETVFHYHPLCKRYADWDTAYYAVVRRSEALR